MSFFHTLRQDEDTALDALGDLAQNDSTEATIAEDATEAWFALEQAWALGELIAD
jgi:hypothetical protein